MEEQLPTPIFELVVLHLYLSSITLLSGIIVLYLIMKSKNKFTWPKYITNSILMLLIVVILALLIWIKWPFKFDFMLGPFNLPTIAILFMFLGTYALMKNTKSI